MHINAQSFRRISVVRVILSALLFVSAASPQSNAQCYRDWVYSPEGTNGKVNCMTMWDPDGAGPLASVLVVGGSFDLAGNGPANNIAYWDGTGWHPLGQGLNGEVNCLAVRNGELIAGGSFTQSSATSVSRIGRWTGSAWQSLASGVSAPVRSMAVNGAELWVGGAFQTVGGGALSSPFVARYNGTWQAVPAGFSNTVTELVMYSGQPVAATVSDSAVWSVKRLAGANGWITITTCRSFGGMQEFNGQLYLSGQFVEDGVDIALQRKVKRWNGTTLDVFVSGVSVTAWGVYNNQLVMMGKARSLFTGGSDVVWNKILPVTGQLSEWTQAPSKPPNCFLQHSNLDFFCGGEFESNGGVIASNVAQLRSGEWRPLFRGANNTVRTTAYYGGQHYIGGDFTSIGSVNGTGIMRWDGTYWDNVPFSSMNGTVTTMLSLSSGVPGSIPNLIIGGTFTSAGGLSATRIASYNYLSNAWTTFGAGLNGTPLALTSISVSPTRRDLVVGGQFTQAGGTTVNRIARYSSGSWQSFSTGMNGDVRALLNFQGQVVAAGTFTTAGGTPCNRIASWDGSAWQPLGNGLNATVRAMTVFDGKLVVGGDFTTAGGASASRIAQWDGTVWQPMGSLSNSVYTFAILEGSLLAGGSFSADVPQAFERIAQWSGTEWIPFNSGYGNADGTVLSMSVGGGTLSVGGSFTRINDQDSPNISLASPNSGPRTTFDPEDQTVCAGDEATMYAFTASSGWLPQIPAPSRAWYRNSIALVDGPTPHGSIIFGSNTPALSIQNAQPQDAGTYRMRSTRCDISINTASATLSINAGPAITVQPSFEGACLNQPFEISVVASGNPPLLYSWSKDGESLGQSASTITFANLSALDNGTYVCEIMNSDGCGVSRTVPAVLVAGVCCAADFNEDGVLDLFDYLDFVIVFAASDPTADFNRDSVVDFFDYLDFVQAFSEGC